MNRWLVTGAAGMLGRDLVTLLRENGEPVVTTTPRDLDIRDRTAIEAAVRRHRPTVVVNCAAATRIHEVERHETDALLVNGTAVRDLASVCASAGVRLVHLSSDYVFGGDAREPWSEDAPTQPVNAYGRTKVAGERAVRDVLGDKGFIVRTAWLFGRHGTHFVRQMASLAAAGDTVDVVNDQWGQPTWTLDVAERIHALVMKDAPGVYHATSSGACTWYDLARETFRQLGADPARVRSVSSDQFAEPVRRPRYSVLGHDGWARAGLDPLRSWQDALAAFLPQLG